MSGMLEILLTSLKLLTDGRFLTCKVIIHLALPGNLRSLLAIMDIRFQVHLLHMS